MLRQEWVNPDELQAVLRELHADELQERLQHPDDEDDLHPDDVTVAAISEVTGASPENVMRILQEIRRDRREEELAHRLAKMEEPIYRVERPSPDNVSKSSALDAAFAKRHSVNTTLSDLERREVKRVKIRTRKLSEVEKLRLETEKAKLEAENSKWGAVVTIFFLAVFLVAFVLATLNSTGGPR